MPDSEKDLEKNNIYKVLAPPKNCLSMFEVSLSPIKLKRPNFFHQPDQPAVISWVG